MTQRTSPDEVARHFDAEDREAEAFVPRFNVAPTDPVIVVLEREDGRVVERHRWGLIPHWADAPNAGARMINARSETLMTSSAFRVPFRKRRCVVASDGFYEWRRRDGARDAFFMHRADEHGGADSILPMAGLWSVWRDPATGVWIRSCAVITTQASAQMAPLHDRMPVILAPEAWRTWLDPDETDPDVLRGLLVPAPLGTLDITPVSSRVNSVRNDGPDLVEPFVQPDQAALFA